MNANNTFNTHNSQFMKSNNLFDSQNNKFVNSYNFKINDKDMDID